MLAEPVGSIPACVRPGGEDRPVGATTRRRVRAPVVTGAREPFRPLRLPSAITGLEQRGRPRCPFPLRGRNATPRGGTIPRPALRRAGSHAGHVTSAGRSRRKGPQRPMEGTPTPYTGGRVGRRVSGRSGGGHGAVGHFHARGGYRPTGPPARPKAVWNTSRPRRPRPGGGRKRSVRRPTAPSACRHVE